GCPALGYLTDRIGLRKPVMWGGMALMLAAALAIFYLLPQTFRPYVLAFLLGFGSGAAMIPSSIISGVNPDHATDRATGAMNLLVFVMTALVAPVIGWWMQSLAGGGALTLDVFIASGNVYIAAIMGAAVLTFFLKETGSAVRA